MKENGEAGIFLNRQYQMPQLTTTLMSLVTCFKSQVTTSARSPSPADYTISLHIEDLPHVIKELLVPFQHYKLLTSGLTGVKFTHLLPIRIPG